MLLSLGQNASRSGVKNRYIVTRLIDNLNSWRGLAFRLAPAGTEILSGNDHDLAKVLFGRHPLVRSPDIA